VRILTTLSFICECTLHETGAPSGKSTKGRATHGLLERHRGRCGLTRQVNGWRNRLICSGQHTKSTTKDHTCSPQPMRRPQSTAQVGMQAVQQPPHLRQATWLSGTDSSRQAPEHQTFLSRAPVVVTPRTESGRLAPLELTSGQPRGSGPYQPTASQTPGQEEQAFQGWMAQEHLALGHHLHPRHSQLETPWGVGCDEYCTLAHRRTRTSAH